MPSGYGPWTVENRGHGWLVLVAVFGAAATAAGMGVYWLLADTVFLVVALSALSVTSAAGLTLAVRNVARDRKLLYRGAYRESLFRSAPRAAVEPARVPVRALPVVAPLAIEAPKRVLTGVVIRKDDEHERLAEAIEVRQPRVLR